MIPLLHVPGDMACPRTARARERRHGIDNPLHSRLLRRDRAHYDTAAGFAIGVPLDPHQGKSDSPGNHFDLDGIEPDKIDRRDVLAHGRRLPAASPRSLEVAWSVRFPERVKPALFTHPEVVTGFHLITT